VLQCASHSRSYRLKFRSDIQVLRGIAVLWVVLFHFGFTFFESGFLGVDVFFVISGFLMANLYHSGQMMSFFQSRASRLLPAYFVVVIATVIAAFVFTTPNETSQVLEQTFWASIFSSNIGFWSKASYFSKSEFNPLLHLWSLGVEIQFYLLVPVLFWIISKSRYMFAMLVLLSLIACSIMLTVSPKTSFFLLPFRFWELGFGFLVGFVMRNGKDVALSRSTLLGLPGLAVILLIPFADIDGRTSSFIYGHPGFAALVACLATGSILYFGLPSFIVNNRVGSSLVKLGTYSYSLYLVHFPVIVIYLSRPFDGTNLKVAKPLDFVLLIALIVVLTGCLHQFVENRWRAQGIKRLIVGPVLLVLCVSLTARFVQPWILSPEERAIFAASSDRTEYRCGKIFRVVSPTSEFCEITGSENSDRSVMLVGNSHADAIKTAFASVAASLNTSVYFTVSNSPMLGSANLSPQTIVEAAVERQVDTIILHYSPARLPDAAERFDELINIAAANDIKLVLIDPVPTWSEHVPRALYMNTTQNHELPAQTLDQHRERIANMLVDVKSLQGTSITRWDPAPYLCDVQCSLAQQDRTPFYFDRGHLTVTGSNELTTLFESILRESPSAT